MPETSWIKSEVINTATGEKQDLDIPTDEQGAANISWAVDEKGLKLAKAAAQAQQEGKDAVEAAKSKKAEIDAEEQKAVDLRHYLIAAANLARGKFEELSAAELFEVAALIPNNVLPIEVWKQNLGQKE